MTTPRPRIELPLPSRFDNCQTASQLPTSDQPISAGTTAALPVRSMTAKSIDFFGAFAKASASRTKKFKSGLALTTASAAAAAMSSSKFRNSSSITSARKKEVPGIPEIIFGDIFFRRRGVGVFDEGLDLQHVAAGRHRLSRLDIAIASGGRVRLDSERHDKPKRRRF